MTQVTQTHTRANHREVEVLDALRRLGGAARNANLAALLGVSEETIRRTTKALAKSGLLRRVHGGVYLVNAETGEDVFSRLGRRSQEKSRIANLAAALIPNGSSIFLDVGSTTVFVAHALKRHKRLTVVTNALNAAQALANQRGNRVFLAGGELMRSEWGAFGPETLNFIQGFHFDFAVLSVDGIDPDTGFLLTGSEEAAIARVAIRQASRTIIVADDLKFGKRAPLVLCPPASVDFVVTDKPVAPAFAKAFASWNIEVPVLAPEAAE